MDEVEVTRGDIAGLIARLEYILDPSRSAKDRMVSRAVLTNNDLRMCMAALITSEAAYSAGEARGIERAAEVCEKQAQSFLSEEYATGQPLSSFSERFACGMCISVIRALALDRGEGVK